MPSGGGWRYPQTLKDGSVQWIPPSGCAGTDTELVNQVKLFRINAQVDLGDVAADVAEYIKKQSPQNNRFPKKPTPRLLDTREGGKGFRPYIERIRDWLVSMTGKQPRLLIEDEADARAGACMTCPQNVPWKTGCLPCCDAVVSRGQNVRQRPGYKHDKKLGACRLHDIHLSTAVFIDREHLPELHPDAPEFCWLRKIA